MQGIHNKVRFCKTLTPTYENLTVDCAPTDYQLLYRLFVRMIECLETGNLKANYRFVSYLDCLSVDFFFDITLGI